jgi:hypothetical protein
MPALQAMCLAVAGVGTMTRAPEFSTDVKRRRRVAAAVYVVVLVALVLLVVWRLASPPLS